MNFLDKLRSVEEAEPTPKSYEPVDKKDLEVLIDIINVAQGCYFKLTLVFPIGDFTVESVNFKGIKIMPATKNDPERVIVSYTDTLSSTDVTIPLHNVIGASLDLHISQYGEENV